MTRSVPHQEHDLMTALLGPGRIEGTPRAWTSDDQKVHIRIYYLGSSLCFHQGVAHGGLLATLMDEAFARCCAPFLPHNVGVTASFTLDYKAPVHVTQYIVLHAEIVNVEGCKAWLQGYITPLPASNEKPLVLVEASSLFVSPREAEAS
ncbi:HotDog domain-containing protein, partial [Diaporthe sp. PMI_573]